MPQDQAPEPAETAETVTPETAAETAAPEAPAGGDGGSDGEVTPPPAETAETVEGGEAEADTFPRKVVEDLRGENAGHRTKNKALQDQLDALMAGIKGLTGEDAEVEQTPEEALAAAQAERDAAATELRTMRLEKAIDAAAKTADADPAALADSRTFMKKVADIDPTAEDHAAQVAALASEFVTANPKARATPAVPGSSGSAPEDAKPTGPQQLTRDELAALPASERLKAVRDGRTRDILAGKK